MRVREYIRDVVDGAEPHFVLVQPRAQFVQCMFGDFVPDDGIERLPVRDALGVGQEARVRSEEHTSELQSLMRSSYAVLCLKKKNTKMTKQKLVHQQRQQ